MDFNGKTLWPITYTYIKKKKVRQHLAIVEGQMSVTAACLKDPADI